MRAFVLLTILTLITIAVFIFGIVQRIELEVENASLKQQIETYEANAAEAKKSADKAYKGALEAMAHADSLHNQYIQDSIKNASK